MLYFAYGSNMSIKRLQKRVKTAQFIGQYYLLKHSLKFHKISKDGSGKCDAYFTGNKQDKVFGVLFDFQSREKPQLDKAENLGWGYEQKEVELTNHEGEFINAYTYYAIKINPSLQPYSWYKYHVTQGAKLASLPKDYVNFIHNYPSIKDKNQAREKLELSIY